MGWNKEEMFVSGVLKQKVKTYGAFTRLGQYDASKRRKKKRKQSKRTLPPSIKTSNLIYLYTNLFLCSSCRVHPALLLKLHLLSVSFRLIMPWHSAKIVSLKDVTRALTQHSMSWNTINTGLAQAAIWMLKKSDVFQVCYDTKANLFSAISSLK